MKKLILFASAVVLSVSVFAQSQQAQKAEDVVKFKELTYDFGKIKQGTPVTHDFDFSNISTNPVIIESATASCGCTTPVKPEGAIQAGKSDVLKAGFNAQAVGPFNKSIYVKVAGVQMPLTLHITGEVVGTTPTTPATAGSKSGK
jgi:hypothetical protein